MIKVLMIIFLCKATGGGVTSQYTNMAECVMIKKTLESKNSFVRSIYNEVTCIEVKND